MDLIILTPVYNDWESFARLLEDLASIPGGHRARVVAVDDASSQTPDPKSLVAAPLPVTVIHLNTNLGHQRAIAAGLAHLNQGGVGADAVVVMDSDGEDRVRDIPALLEAYERGGRERLVFAHRARRSENLRFRLGYRVYKLLFHLLTGRRISFGNFSCLPPAHVEKLAYHPDAWNHYSGCVLKAGLPFDTVATDRGARYSGQSKMNTRGLLLHGLSSISLYMDEVSVRLLGVSFLGILLGGLALVTTFAVRLFTDLAIPGWATYVSLMLLNVISLMFVVSLLGLMLRLNGRNNVQLPPARLYEGFILRIERFPEGVEA